MLEYLNRMYILFMCNVNDFFEEEKGAVDLVTIVVLIGIAVVLAVLFREKINDLLETLFGQIGSSAESAISPS